MALIVEDGTGVANANSYVSRASYIAYAGARGVVVADNEAADIDLINAMDYVEIQCYIGEPAGLEDQALSFPRKGLIAGDTAEDYTYTIPSNITKAQMQLAIYSRNGIALLPARSADAPILEEKIGPITTKYGAPSYAPDIPLAAALLAPLQCGQGGFRLKTYRA